MAVKKIPFLGKIGSLLVVKGITKPQVNQLINFTNKDDQIKQYTHDEKRFKDRKTYTDWLKNNKIIYTLTDDQNNLLGIIWLSNKKIPEAPEYEFTFAIRIYPPIRGLGYAKRFIKIVISDFADKKIWLSTLTENDRAIKLYTNIGFKEIAKRNNEILMILQNSERKRIRIMSK